MVSGFLLPSLLTLLAATAQACNFLTKRELKCGSEPWGYLSTNGPQTWSAVDSACTFGGPSVGHQTPIHVGSEVPREKGDSRKFALPRGGFELLNNGHTVVASSAAPAGTAEGASGMEAGGEVWVFEQFHFHTPAEHTLPKGGSGPPERQPMEVHFVHKSAKDPTALAVVGMFFELVDDAKGNKFAETLANALPKLSNCGDKTVVQGLGKILADEVAPFFADAGVDIATYSGSLTTPPCSEGVRWFVVTNRRIPITKDQAKAFRKVLGSNARCTANVYAEAGWKNVAAACEKPGQAA